MKIALKVRPGQAQVIAEALAELAMARAALQHAQECADVACAAVIAGLVPANTGVLGVDVEKGTVMVLTPPPKKGAHAPHS